MSMKPDCTNSIILDTLAHNREKGRVAFGGKRKVKFTKNSRHEHFIALEKESRKSRVTRIKGYGSIVW